MKFSEFSALVTESSFENALKQVENIEVDKEIGIGQIITFLAILTLVPIVGKLVFPIFVGGEAVIDAYMDL